VKRFLKYFLAVILGGLVTTLLVFLFFMAFMAAIASKDKKTFEILPNSVYNIKLNKPIQERAPESFFDYVNIFPEAQTSTLGLNDILLNIEKAGEDSNIKGIFLDLSYVQAGIATVNEIRQALIKFKQTGKFVIAYGDYYDKRAYYLASVADEIYMNPLGVLEFTGLKSEINFFKGTFEKLGIEAKVFRVGKYKSFGERYDSKKLSDENREQILVYVNGAWNLMLNEISKSRNIQKEKLNKIASTLDTDTPEKTLENKLIDGLKYKDEVILLIKEKCGLSATSKFKMVSHVQMKKVEKKTGHRGFIKDKIAVIYAWGTVQMGSGKEGDIGADRISKAIKKAREDSAVKALVIRVNSGGGSAMASEIIWRELDLTRKVKPVVASMGDVAASGGYYILAPADTIVANPYTLTGSIGVVGVLINAQKFFNEKAGITHDIVKTNPYADFGSIFRPITPFEEASVNNMIKVVYKSFVNHVAEARNMNYNSVHAVAQGRIWLATNALENKLIDKFGGLHDAIETAASMAGLEIYRVENLPRLKEPFEKLFKDAAEEVKQNALKNKLGIMYDYYKEINDVFSSGTYQAILPYEIKLN